MREETLLAYEMNGVPLPTEHGFPIRLLNPGHYGTKNPKWIVNIQLAAAHESYWEKRGWDPIANVKLATMIGTPTDGEEITGGKVYTVSGAAFDAGNHGGIKKVEVSVDYGQTWGSSRNLGRRIRHSHGCYGNGIGTSRKRKIPSKFMQEPQRIAVLYKMKSVLRRIRLVLRPIT